VLIKSIKVSVLITVLTLLAACSNDDSIGRIVIGNGNTLSSLNDLQYQDPFVIQLTDVNGNAVTNTQVRIQLKSITYHKGAYQKTGDGWAPNYSIKDCVAEDMNNNGILDAGEDINGNGTLEPTNPATIAQHNEFTPTLLEGSNILITDEFGFGYFAVTYPKSEANWSIVEIIATASFSGSENIATKTVNLLALLTDLEDEDVAPLGGDGLSPYGTVGDCTDPN